MPSWDACIIIALLLAPCLSGVARERGAIRAPTVGLRAAVRRRCLDPHRVLQIPRVLIEAHKYGQIIVLAA